MNFKLIKNSRFYLNSTFDVFMTYHRFLFSKFSIIPLFLIWIKNKLELKVFDTEIFFFRLMINGQAFQVNFSYALHSFDQ